MLPDALAFLQSLPSAFHVEAQDAEGVWHDAVKLADSAAYEASEYGLSRKGMDQVFVALPFTAPKARLIYRLADGTEISRRILSFADHVVFGTIDLDD